MIKFEDRCPNVVSSKFVRGKCSKAYGDRLALGLGSLIGAVVATATASAAVRYPMAKVLVAKGHIVAAGAAAAAAAAAEAAADASGRQSCSMFRGVRLIPAMGSP